MNVVDLMTLQPQVEHPHGLSDDRLRRDLHDRRPIVFAFHGYPWLIHRLTYRRTNHGNLHVRGYKEEGTTTTPFDMTVMNDLDRFHLVLDVIARVPGLAQSDAGQAHAHYCRDTTGGASRLHPRSMATTCRTCATGGGRRDGHRRSHAKR